MAGSHIKVELGLVTRSNPSSILTNLGGQPAVSQPCRSQPAMSSDNPGS